MGRALERRKGEMVGVMRRTAEAHGEREKVLGRWMNASFERLLLAGLLLAGSADLERRLRPRLP